MKRILTIALLMLSCCGLFAQKHFTMDLNGLVIGQTYTKNQVVAKLGEPSSYSCTDSEFGTDQIFFYGKNETTEIDLQHGGEFYFFTVAEKNMPILTNLIAGGIRVGENISAMKKVGLPYSLRVKGEYIMMFGDDVMRILVDEKDIITRFIYIVPD